jgi:hypothetical protein
MFCLVCRLICAGIHQPHFCERQTALRQMGRGRARVPHFGLRALPVWQTGCRPDVVPRPTHALADGPGSHGGSRHVRLRRQPGHASCRYHPLVADAQTILHARPAHRGCRMDWGRRSHDRDWLLRGLPEAPDCGAFRSDDWFNESGGTRCPCERDAVGFSRPPRALAMDPNRTPVPQRNIIGKGARVYWPFTRFNVLDEQ